MKLARTDRAALAIVLDSTDGQRMVLDVPASLDRFGQRSPRDATTIAGLLAKHPSWIPLIAQWDDARAPLATMQDWALHSERGDAKFDLLSDVRLLAPVPAVDSRVFAVGANFAPHAALAERAIRGDDDEVDSRTAELLAAKAQGIPPWGFNVLPGTIVGPDDEITRPTGVEKLDYEGEVAVVFRAPLDASGQVGAVDVWGVTAWNDFSIRDPHFGLGRPIDRPPLTWSLQKNFDTGSACGPWVVVDEGLDAASLDLSLRVNGETRQVGSTSEMIYSFTDVIEHISPFLTLRSGDMIASGTPSGTAFEQGVDGPYLRKGDTVEVQVEGVGVLRNTVVA